MTREPIRPLLLLLAVAAAACGQSKASPTSDGAAVLPDGPKSVRFDPKTLERLGVKVEPAGMSARALDLEVPGTLEYSLERYAEVGSIVDGRVMQLGYKPGDSVKRGAVLASIIVPSIASAQAEYLATEATAKSARDNAAREVALLEKNLTTAREAEVAKAEATRTQAELAAAGARLQALGVSRPSSDTQVSGAGMLTLRAPIDGVVVRRDAVLGRYLQAKETAFVIADPLLLRAALNVYEADLPYFRVGQEAEISVDAMPGTVLKGKIALVEPQVGRSSRTARAYIDVPNPDGVLKPGLFVRASLRVHENTDTSKVLVPAPAVQPVGDDEVVFVEREPGVFEVR